MSTAQTSAEWIVAKIKAEAEAQGQPLADEDEQMLRMDMHAFGPQDRARMIALNNRVVGLVRKAIERDKRGGAPVTKERRGLRIPTDWVQHHGNVYAANTSLPWAVSGILQNAMRSTRSAASTASGSRHRLGRREERVSASGSCRCEERRVGTTPKTGCRAYASRIAGVSASVSRKLSRTRELRLFAPPLSRTCARSSHRRVSRAGYRFSCGTCAARRGKLGKWTTRRTQGQRSGITTQAPPALR